MDEITTLRVFDGDTEYDDIESYRHSQTVTVLGKVEQTDVELLTSAVEEYVANEPNWNYQDARDLVEGLLRGMGYTTLTEHYVEVW